MGLQETRVFGVRSVVHRAGITRRLRFWVLGTNMLQIIPNFTQGFQITFKAYIKSLVIFGIIN
jgi:hypothetical protein